MFLRTPRFTKTVKIFFRIPKFSYENSDFFFFFFFANFKIFENSGNIDTNSVALMGFRKKRSEYFQEFRNL